MLDTRRVFLENNNPLQGLVNFESKVQQLDVECPVKVQFATNGNTVQFIHDGLVLNGTVDRPLIHQLGARAWGQKQSFKSISELWHKKFKFNRTELEQELAAVFSRYDLTIRYNTDKRGQNQVYGIVTPRFIDVDQLEFRKNFIDQACLTTGLIPESTGFEKGLFGEVTEYFKFDNPGFQTEFKYGLVYARNNGYEAYRVNWGRLIIICTNGLKAWKGVNFSWKHTKEVDLSEFISKTVNEGIANQNFLEEKITSSRNTQLNQSKIAALMQRMSLAQASKDRVVNRLAVEANEVGYNEWALSQSLTWLGSHEKSIQRRSKQQLTGLGTDILEHSLAEVLDEESKLYYDGSYGLVLPKGFERGYAIA